MVRKEQRSDFTRSSNRKVLMEILMFILELFIFMAIVGTFMFLLFVMVYHIIGWYQKLENDRRKI